MLHKNLTIIRTNKDLLDGFEQHNLPKVIFVNVSKVTHPYLDFELTFNHMDSVLLLGGFQVDYYNYRSSIYNLEDVVHHALNDMGLTTKRQIIINQT